MAVIDLKKAQVKGEVCRGQVYLKNDVDIRLDKNNNEFMTGQFTDPSGDHDFKIWNSQAGAIELIKQQGSAIYEATLRCDEFNNSYYFTVLDLRENSDDQVNKYHFLPAIPSDRIKSFWQSTLTKLNKLGVSAKCWQLVQQLLAAPELEGRFQIEGAAIRHHDNKIGGLVNHTSKMLNLLAALLENLPELLPNADLLTLGIILHDIGKVWEYRDLAEGEYWFVNHRVRGVEFLVAYKELVIKTYDEEFYRQLQAIIAGHHGDYGDRPSSIATAIVHFIDLLESQVTGLVEEQAANPLNQKILYSGWGYLRSLPEQANEE